MNATNEKSRLPSTRFPVRRNEHEKSEAVHSNRLPAMKFSLNTRNHARNSEKIKLASKNCPNYIMLSANLTHIQSFVEKFSNSLARKNSRYALFTNDENISTKSSLSDIKFFKKVLNLAIIGMSKNIDRTFGIESFIDRPHPKR